MGINLRKLPDYKNASGRYAQIELYPGAAKVRNWKTLWLNADLGTYAVTVANPHHRLVLRPKNGSPIEYLDYTDTIKISRADKKSELFVLVFERGVLIKGPSPESVGD